MLDFADPGIKMISWFNPAGANPTGQISEEYIKRMNTIIVDVGEQLIVASEPPNFLSGIGWLAEGLMDTKSEGCTSQTWERLLGPGASYWIAAMNAYEWPWHANINSLLGFDTFIHGGAVFVLMYGARACQNTHPL